MGKSTISMSAIFQVRKLKSSLPEDNFHFAFGCFYGTLKSRTVVFMGCLNKQKTALEAHVPILSSACGSRHIRVISKHLASVSQAVLS